MTAPSLPQFPNALEPSYICAVNQPIPLHRGRVKVFSGNTVLEGNGLLCYKWQPYEGPELETDIQSLALSNESKVEFGDLGLVATLQKPRRSTLGTEDSRTLAILKGDVEFGSFTNVTRIDFHIGNFRSVLGAVIQRGSTYMRARIEWNSPPWQVTIDPVPGICDSGSVLASQLAEQSGRAITHCGRLSRSDKGLFVRNEALDVLRDVGRTISFARGSFSNPLLLSAYNQTGDKVWECWSRSRTDPWNSRENWFSEMKPEILESVFAGWRALSASPKDEIINAAIHLYLNAHAQGLALESRLVLLQSALEGLADGWPYPPLPSAPAIPKMESGAAERIARIAVSLGITLAVDPMLLPELAAFTKPSPTSPIQAKMVCIRNQIAHLNNLPKLAAYDWKLRFEAKQVAALHLELALLRLLDANGEYLNRLSARHYGDEARLPWH